MQQVGREFANLAPRVAAERDAPRKGATHRTHHVQVAGVAVADEARAVALPLRHFGQLRADQMGEGKVLEEDPHELCLREAEDKIVLAALAVAGLRAPARTAAALRPFDAIA